MGGKAIGVLLLVAVGLGAVLYFTDEKVSIKKTAETAVLDGRSLLDSVRIRWQFRGRPAIEIGRAADGRFQIQEPIVDIASRAYMRQMVTAWDSTNMRATPLVNDAAGRKQAGLESPELTFIVEFPNGDSSENIRYEILVGDPGPLGTTRFLLRDGKIWEGGQGLVSSTRVGLENMRERSVFRHQPSQASELRVDQLLPSGKREALHLKYVAGNWQLLSPVTGRADARAALRFLTAVLSLRVDYFQPGLVTLPDEPPALDITVRGMMGEEHVKLWMAEGQLYGQLPDRNVVFNSDNLQYSAIFVNAAQELRARILVPMEESTFEELVELIIDPGHGRGDRIRLVRSSSTSDWQMVEPVEFAVRATPVNESAHALQRLVAMEFVDDDAPDRVRPRADDPRYGMAGARWTVSTRRVNKRVVNTLWFGADVQGLAEPTVYVCRADEPDNIALVPRHPLDVLQRPWTEYCELQVVKQPAMISRLDVTHRDGRKRKFKISGDEWVLVGGEGEDTERPEVGEFANEELRELHGKRAVDMRTGFAEHDWRLEMMRVNGDILGEIYIWDREGEQLLVKLHVKGAEESKVGRELGARNSRALRELWK